MSRRTLRKSGCGDRKPPTVDSHHRRLLTRQRANMTPGRTADRVGPPNVRTPSDETADRHQARTTVSTSSTVRADRRRTGWHQLSTRWHRRENCAPRTLLRVASSNAIRARPDTSPEAAKPGKLVVRHPHGLFGQASVFRRAEQSPARHAVTLVATCRVIKHDLGVTCPEHIKTIEPPSMKVETLLPAWGPFHADSARVPGGADTTTQRQSPSLASLRR
jgi:hypothetical protein